MRTLVARLIRWTSRGRTVVQITSIDINSSLDGLDLYRLSLGRPFMDAIWTYVFEKKNIRVINYLSNNFTTLSILIKVLML